MKLLAIDPGAHTGFALFVLLGAHWALQECGVVKPSERAWPSMKPDGGVCVIEVPVIYPHSRARPADILKLRGIAGQYEERFHRCDVHLVEPREWKGTVDGDIFVNRIREGLTSTEAAVFAAYRGGYAHNAVDAIGLGKWAQRQPWAPKVVLAKPGRLA